MFLRQRYNIDVEHIYIYTGCPRRNVSSKHLTWAHIDLCTQQLSPMYHLEEGNIESSRNRYFLKK